MVRPMGKSWGRLHMLFRYLQVMRRSLSRFTYPSELEHPIFMPHPLPWGQAINPNQFFQKQNPCPELCGSHQKHLIHFCTQESTRTYEIPLDAHLCLKLRENQIIYRWLTKDPLWGWAENWVPSAVPVLVVWPEKTLFLMRLNDEVELTSSKYSFPSTSFRRLGAPIRPVFSCLCKISEPNEKSAIHKFGKL